MGMVIKIVMLVRSAASAATSTSSPAATGLFLPNHHNLEPYLLEGQLIPGATQKIHGALRRLMGCAQLDTDRFAEQMGKIILHLAI